MKKLNLGTFGATQRGMLVVSTLVSVVMFGQTTSEVRKIRAASNERNTSAFRNLKENTTPTAKQMMEKAKRLNLKYMGQENGKFYQLVGLDERGLPLYYETSNAGAAAATGAAVLNDESGVYKLDGQNINIYEWDGGAIRVSHREFGGRAVQVDQPSALNEHSTHVAGTMIAAGLDRNAKGMAYRANLKAHDWTSDLVEMTVAAKGGALISNHSYGFSSGFVWGSQSGNTGWHWMGDDNDTEFIGYGQYRATDADWDFLLTQNPYYLPVKAAGNPRGDGPEPGGLHYVRVLENGAYVWKTSTKVRQKNGGAEGYDSVNQGATAKNILVVAAAEKLPKNSTSSEDIKPATFSGFGPADDGRIKPDITGIGVDVYSLSSTGDASYTTMSGTSMASPNVTGNLALLQQHYNKLYASFMKSATLKALVINTAREAGAAPGPDYKFGWGLIDSKQAADAISFKNKYSAIQEETLATGSTKEISLVAEGNKPLKVTVAWLDPRPSTVSNAALLDDPTAMLINDLDIKITEGDKVYLPWVLNPASPGSAAGKGDNTRDNVEQILIENPTPGATYRLTVSHKGTVLKKNELSGTTVKLVDAAEQEFSLVATGLKGDLTTDIAVQSVTVTVDNKKYTANTPVEVTYSNPGKSPIASAVLAVTLKDKTTGAVLQTKEITVQNILPGETKKDTFTLDLVKPFTDYDIQVKAVLAGDEMEVNNFANASAYTTVVDLTKPTAMHSFNFESDFSSNGWTSEDADKNGRTWYKYDSSVYAKTGSSFAINFANLSKGSNDWLFSNPLMMKANTKYVISFHSRKLRTLSEPLQLFFGKEPSSAAMTSAVSPVIETPLEYTQYIYEVIPAEDGIFHFGFQNKVPADQQSYAVFVDDVVIKQAEDKPMASFSANKVSATTFEDVTLKNESVAAPSVPVTYEWTITPSTFTYINGSSASPSPVVRFKEEGVYSVGLKATNVYGSDTMVKTNYITVKNTATTADFTANKTSIFENEQVSFTNKSAGNPAPQSYKWSVTPSQGVSFVAGTTDTSANPVMAFAKAGQYTVSLTAKSEMNEATAVKNNYITVKSYYDAVRNLTKAFNETTRDVKLRWERPALLDNYFEGFENGGKPTAGYTFYDENADGMGWLPKSNQLLSTGSVVKNAKSGTYGMVSNSYSSRGAIDALNWMVTDKLKKGSEILKFSALALYPEALEVWVVPAPASGNAPTLDEVKAGTKVYDNTLDNNDFEDISINIKDKVTSDFFVAFYHKTKKEANSWYLAIDDVMVGYDNSVSPVTVVNKTPEHVQQPASRSVLNQVKEGKILMEEEATVHNFSDAAPVPFAATNYPALVGYNVYKNDVLYREIKDPAVLTAEDNLAGATGTVKYDVKALYSDGVASDPRTVIIELTTLATGEVGGDTRGLAVYPNPSSGLFMIDAGNKVSGFEAKVYDMSGKILLSKKANSSKMNIDLTANGKGIYILHVTTNEGKKTSVKLIVK